MSPQVEAAFARLPEYLAWHVLLSASALGLGLLISLPLAVAASRNRHIRWPVLAGASLIQTIPSLALLALFFPLLLVISAASEDLIGYGFSALGFLPALLALTLYSMLPIVRNGTTGILSVSPAIIQAAEGVGMTPRQRLFQVELPLAAPVIMAGVRTAAVWTIGAATLSTPVGQTSLGNYIFSGLQTENWVLVLFGCGASALLAMVTDQLLGLIEAGAAKRDVKRAAIGAAGILIGIVVALTPLISFGKPASYVVGAKNFSEQYILAEMIAERIEDLGGEARSKEDLGSAIAYRALASGEIDVYVDYSGTLWANVLNREDNPGRQAVLEELTKQLAERDGVLVLGSLGFENAYALAMRQDRAAALGITTLDDLARRSASLTMGGDLEFFARPEWQAINEAYGFDFRARRSYQPTFMFRAVTSGDVDVISAFSSDGRIAADDLVTLADPRQALPPYDAVVLIAPDRVNDARLLAALRPLIGAIPVEAMRDANYSVDRDVDKLRPVEAGRALSQRLGLD